MRLLAYATKRLRLLALAHAVVGHDDLHIDRSSGRIFCRSCATVLSPGRSV